MRAWLRAFGPPLLLLGLVAAFSWWLSLSIGRPVAAASAEGLVSRGQTAQAGLHQEALRRLELLADALASDAILRGAFEPPPAPPSPPVVAAPPPASAGAWRDQLAQRRSAADLALLLLLDAAARPLPGAGNGPQHAWQSEPLALLARSKGRAFGTIRVGGVLYAAGAVALQRDFDLLGFAVAAYALDAQFAREASQLSGAEMMIFPLGGEVEFTATSLDAQTATLLGIELRRAGALERLAATTTIADLRLAGERYLNLVAPLRGADDRPIGIVLAVAPHQLVLAPFRRLAALLLAAPALAALLWGVIAMLGQRASSPLTQLVRVVEAAKGGALDQRTGLRGGGEAGRLSSAIDHLLDRLQRQALLPGFQRQAARRRPIAPAAEPLAATLDAALLLVENRSLCLASALDNPGRAVALAAADEGWVRGAVLAEGGAVIGTVGLRTLAAFDGEAAVRRAARAGAAILGRLEERQSAFDERAAPLAAIARGKVVHGRTAEGAEVLAGNAVRVLESTIREASPGELVIAKGAFAELEAELPALGIEAAPQRGVLSPQPILVLQRDQARAFGASPSLLHTLSIHPGSELFERFVVRAIVSSRRHALLLAVEDRDQGELVALRLVEPEGWGGPAELERVLRDHEQARRLTHPGVARSLGVFAAPGGHALLREFVPGVSVRDLARAGSLPPIALQLGFATALVSALKAAHQAGVTHRALVPERVLIDAGGELRVVDCGYRLPLDERRSRERGAFIAPEVQDGAEADTRSDLYALAACLYLLLTGRAPYDGRASGVPPAPPSSLRRGLPAALDKALLRALLPESSQRPESVDALLAALAS